MSHNYFLHQEHSSNIRHATHQQYHPSYVNPVSSTTTRNSTRREPFVIPWRGCFFKTCRTTASTRLVITNQADLTPIARLLKKEFKPFVTRSIQDMIIISLDLAGVYVKNYLNQPTKITTWNQVLDAINQSKDDTGMLFIKVIFLYLFIKMSF